MGLARTVQEAKPSLNRLWHSPILIPVRSRLCLAFVHLQLRAASILHGCSVGQRSGAVRLGCSEAASLILGVENGPFLEGRVREGLLGGATAASYMGDSVHARSGHVRST